MYHEDGAGGTDYLWLGVFSASRYDDDILFALSGSSRTDPP